MNRRDFIKAAGIVTAAFTLNASSSPLVRSTNKKPNVIMFFADDLGFADVGYHGCKDIPTPNIDSIAQNGAQFSAAYVTASVCGPSRAGLLTGRYQQRFGFEGNPGPFRQSPETEIRIPESEKTIGERMKPLGYTTAFIGKHHAGKEPYNNPVNRGFDFFFGFDNGASEYFIEDNPKKMLIKGKTPVDYEADYLTDAFGREAVSFIEENKSNPFFLYLSFNAVHGPMQAPEELKDKFSHIKVEGRRSLAAMLWSMDQNIGRVMQTLRRHNLEDDTLIIFTSDNGGAEEKSNHSSNLPFRDIKGSMYEGGLRIPFCVQWKPVIGAGQKFDFPITTLDIMPTAINAAGGAVADSWELDGIDLLPYLTKKKTDSPKRYLYWRMLYGWAIRDDKWKLVQPWGGRDWGRDKKTELYEIVSDLSEEKNVIEEYPEEAKRLRKVWDQWSSSLMEPQWGWQQGKCGNHRIPLPG